MSIVARWESRSAISSASRDLPSPASPSTVSNCVLPLATARSNVASAAASSRSRPIMGADEPPAHRGRARDQCHQPPVRLGRLDLDRVGREPPRRVAHQDLAVLRARGQPARRRRAAPRSRSRRLRTRRSRRCRAPMPRPPAVGRELRLKPSATRSARRTSSSRARGTPKIASSSWPGPETKVPPCSATMSAASWRAACVSRRSSSGSTDRQCSSATITVAVRRVITAGGGGGGAGASRVLDAARVQAERPHDPGRLRLLLQHERVHAVQPQLPGQHETGRPAADNDHVNHEVPRYEYRPVVPRGTARVSAAPVSAGSGLGRVILRYDRGLAASPLVRYKLRVERSDDSPLPGHRRRPSEARSTVLSWQPESI